MRCGMRVTDARHRGPKYKSFLVARFGVDQPSVPDLLSALLPLRLTGQNHNQVAAQEANRCQVSMATGLVPTVAMLIGQFVTYAIGVRHPSMRLRCINKLCQVRVLVSTGLAYSAIISTSLIEPYATAVRHQCHQCQVSGQVSGYLSLTQAATGCVHNVETITILTGMSATVAKNLAQLVLAWNLLAPVVRRVLHQSQA